MIKRALFVLFFCFGGFLFYVPYWILFGTKGSRERKRLIKLQEEQLKLARQKAGGQYVTSSWAEQNPKP